MTHEEFDKRVAQIDERHRGRPGVLKWRVLALAFAGYAGFLAWFAIVAALSAVFIVPGIVWPLAQSWWLLLLGLLILLIGGVNALRALWVRVKAPEGRGVTEKEAPALFDMLHSLRRDLGTPAFDQVLVTAACNAGVNEVARFGVLGWPRHYLQLGLPLLECLSAEELRAVLAHEYAHRSRRHGRVSGWIYRLRGSWEQVFTEFRNRPHVRGEVSLRYGVAKFIEWFWPRFNAHAFVLSRAHEFEADATAARVAGAEYVAGSLLRLDLASRLLNEKFWPDLWLEANAHPEPPSGVFLRLRDRLRADPPAEAKTWLAQAFQWVTSNTDTHPCLSARLRALNRLPAEVERGEYPDWPVAPPRSAADTLLEPVLDAIRADVETRWRTECAKFWRDRHDCAAVLRDRLTQMEAAVPAVTASDLWDKAGVVARLQGDAAAVPLLRELLAMQPGHAGANLELGRHLLGENNEGGETYLERAMTEDEETVPRACQLLLEYGHRTGRADLIQNTKARLDRHSAAVAASQTERNRVTESDTFIPHGLSDAELQSVIDHLRADPDVVAADLAQKQMKYFQKQRLFVLCLRTRRNWLGMANRDTEQAVLNRLMSIVRLPGRKLVFTPGGGFRGIASRLSRMPEARIFTRT
jgi:Zn-dependent protease with chaperone function